MKKTEIQQKKEHQKVICYHCGDVCLEDHVVYDGKDFCCNGCRTVYEILNENDLCGYYDLEKNPGISLKSRNFGDKFQYLDNQDIQDQLLQFSDANLAKVTFYIPSIHCTSCIWLLENLYRLKDPVRYSRVNFVKKEVSIDYDPGKITLREIVELLATIGYEPYISLDEESKKKQSFVNRNLLIKIGIAGFSFGNIMLLSFPEYLGFESLDDRLLQSFFQWLIVMLSLPIILYCSTDYFRSAWSGIKQNHININVPITIGIIALFSRSLYEVISQTGPGYFDSLSGLVFFLLIGRWIQNKTYEGLSFERDYKSYFPLAVIRKDNNHEEPVPVKNLIKGDEIIIRNQEIIPTDSLLLSKTAHIDYSFVTGESEPVEKIKNELIYAGGRQIGTSIRLEVQKPVSQSYLTQLWNNEIFSKEDDSPLKNLVDKISKYFTAMVLGIALIAFISWQFIDADKSWFILTAVLIVACPCALSLATPFTQGNTMRIFGLNHFYLKNINVIEKLTRIKHIVLDKTGTITENRSSNITYHGEQLTDEELIWIRSMASNSSHPLSRKIDEFNNGSGNNHKIIPDNYIEKEGMGLEGIIGGNVIHMGSLEYLQNIASFNSSKISSSYSSSLVHISIDHDYKGFFRIENKYRKGISDLIKKLALKYKLSLLSGDNEREKETLTKIFSPGSMLKFYQKPEDKLSYIKAIQQEGEQVLMLGDGLNDAGALKISDVGIAITDDVVSFTPASDAILDGDKLNKLDTFLKFAHTSNHIIIANFVISFLYNTIGLGFAVSGKLTPIIAAILMPLSSITVVVFATFAVNLMAKLRKLI